MRLGKDLFGIGATARVLIKWPGTTGMSTMVERNIGLATLFEGGQGIMSPSVERQSTW